jgi:hypothetical protein
MPAPDQVLAQSRIKGRDASEFGAVIDAPDNDAHDKVSSGQRKKFPSETEAETKGIPGGFALEAASSVYERT